MKANTRTNRPSGCLNVIALAMASVCMAGALWGLFLLAVGPFPPTLPPMACDFEPDTDGYYELCVYGPWFEELTQDEADTIASQERN